MASDYVPMDHSLPDKPEVLAIIEATGESVEVVLFRLFKLWRLADGQTLDGVLKSCGPRALACRCGGTADFWTAVEQVTKTSENPEGWLIFRDGCAIVPRFKERFRTCAKARRNQARSRKAEWKRQQKERDGNAAGTQTERKGNGVGTHNQNQNQNQCITTASAVVSSAETAEAAMTFAKLGGKVWSLPQRKLDEYMATYADRLDVLAELRKARQWLLDNPGRRPKSNMAGFLTRWLNRSYDSSAKTVAGSRVAAADGRLATFNPETGEIVERLE